MNNDIIYTQTRSQHYADLMSQGYYVEPQMPPSHFLDVMTFTKKAMKMRHVIECDKAIANQKFMNYTNIV